MAKTSFYQNGGSYSKGGGQDQQDIVYLLPQVDH